MNNRKNNNKVLLLFIFLRKNYIKWFNFVKTILVFRDIKYILLANQDDYILII